MKLMPIERKLFMIVVWLGILANWTFGAWVVFFDPHSLIACLRLGQVSSTVWIYNYSVLLILLSCFYIPAAHDPLRYRVNAWLLVACRLIPASTFFAGVAAGFMPRGFLMLGLGDATFGILSLILLRRIYRKYRHLEPARA
jgi:hypothetical protein